MSLTTGIRSSILCDSGKNRAPHMVCIWPLFNLQRTILFQSISSLLCPISELLLLIISREPHPPSFADNSYTHRKKNTYFRSLVSALYIDVFIFLKRKLKKKKKDENIKTNPASLRGVSGIYSVYFLHTLHINPHRCRYTAHIMSHSASVFQGKHLSHSF